MAPIEHFAYGWLTPGLAYALSVLGSLLGLVCTARARASDAWASRARWLMLAAWAIGGTGIWVMHFMAMIGFTVGGTQVRYDITITAASWLVAVTVVAIGLFIVGSGRRSGPKVVLAGLFTGVGVAGMHYSGMSAMRTAGHLHYDVRLVTASVIIAVVAATVALWFTVTLRHPAMLTAAALIMGVAVSGMHYTGMSAISISQEAGGRAPTGLSPITFLVPIAIFVVLVIVVLFAALLHRPGGSDLFPLERLDRPAPAAEFSGFTPTSGAGLPTVGTRRPVPDRR